MTKKEIEIKKDDAFDEFIGSNKRFGYFISCTDLLKAAEAFDAGWKSAMRISK